MELKLAAGGKRRKQNKGCANDRTASEHFACSAWSKYDDVQRGLCAGGGKLEDGRDARMSRCGRACKWAMCARAEYSTVQYVRA